MAFAPRLVGTPRIANEGASVRTSRDGPGKVCTVMRL
jgi:hypothetical protein